MVQIAPEKKGPVMVTIQNTNEVIDLTGDDDDELKRAVQMSLEESTADVPTFGPSNRVDETQQWAMVPIKVRSIARFRKFLIHTLDW